MFQLDQRLEEKKLHNFCLREGFPNGGLKNHMIHCLQQMLKHHGEKSLSLAENTPAKKTLTSRPCSTLPQQAQNKLDIWIHMVDYGSFWVENHGKSMGLVPGVLCMFNKYMFAESYQFSTTIRSESAHMFLIWWLCVFVIFCFGLHAHGFGSKQLAELVERNDWANST